MHEQELRNYYEQKVQRGIELKAELQQINTELLELENQVQGLQVQKSALEAQISDNSEAVLYIGEQLGDDEE